MTLPPVAHVLHILLHDEDAEMMGQSKTNLFKGTGKTLKTEKIMKKEQNCTETHTTKKQPRQDNTRP